MAHIESPRRNSNGTWSTRVRYRIGGRGSPLRSHPVLGMPSKKAALEAATHWANDFERRKYLGELTPEHAGRELTCGEFIELWMRLHVLPELEANTQANYRRVVPLYFTAFFGNTGLSQVDRARAYEWREWMIEQTVGRARLESQGGVPTVNRMLQIGKGIFSFAVELGYLRDNPLEHVRALPYRQEKRKRLFAPTPEQVETIRSVISDSRKGEQYWVCLRDRALVSLMAYEGLRQSEVLGAHWWQAIDDAGLVRFHFIIDKSKTPAGEDREVELWEPVRRELGELYLAIGRPDLGSLMFPGVRGAAVSRRNWARDSWLPALAGARLVEGCEDLPHFGAHKLRATCASMLGYALTPKHVMLDFLGHEQETTTIKHYLRAFRDAKARAREGIAVEEQILQARGLFEPDAAARAADAG